MDFTSGIWVFEGDGMRGLGCKEHGGKMDIQRRDSAFFLLSFFLSFLSRGGFGLSAVPSQQQSMGMLFFHRLFMAIYPV